MYPDQTKPNGSDDDTTDTGEKARTVRITLKGKINKWSMTINPAKAENAEEDQRKETPGK